MYWGDIINERLSSVTVCHELQLHWCGAVAARIVWLSCSTGYVLSVFGNYRGLQYVSLAVAKEIAEREVSEKVGVYAQDDSKADEDNT